VRENPYETRDRGSRRTRLVTAAVAAGALVGTGAVALAVASGTAQAAGTTASVPSVQQGQTSVGDDNFGSDNFGDDDGGGFQLPAQPPATGFGGGSGHASSGGS
jgi:uncharacterized membrane protein